MKKKILSLIMSICVCICSLFSLVGCSLVSEDTTKKNKGEVLKVGDKVLTKSDIINNFYTYYQNNNSYFSYYDEETITESFYTWAIIKQMVEEKSFDALYDAETNPNGYIIYTQDDADDVIESMFEYVYNQVNSYETAIYQLHDDIEAKNYPVWIREKTSDDKSSTEASEFEYYESVKPEVKSKTKAEAVKKLTEAQVKEYADDLQKYVFEYVSVEAEDEDDEDERLPINESVSSNYIVGARNEAYARYVEGLVSNAKAAGKSTVEADVINAELVRLYEAYYKSKITTLFQNYYLNNFLLGEECVDINGDGIVDFDKESLSDKAIVKAYLENYFSDVQIYQVEDSYVATMTKDEGASLVLYNYAGRNYFFTVQHILVKYDDYMTKEVEALPGYTQSGNFDKNINDVYVSQRNTLTDNYSMYTTINKDAVKQFKNSIAVEGNYYYYDETLAEYNSETGKGGKADNYGYILLETTEVDGKTVYLKPGQTEPVSEKDVKYLASEEEILSCYKTNLSTWNTLAHQYISANETGRKEIVDAHEEMEYVFETALNIYNSAKADGLSDEVINNKIKNKLGSLLFVELQWIYSTDSLGNTLSNKMGYVVSNYDDENGSWVSDFAVGARNIMASIVNGDTSALNETNIVTSNYGYHIIKIENVFESGASLVDMSGFDKEDISLDNAEFVSEMISRLKGTYVCTSSNQTLYDYYYESIYNEFIGTSESNGTYFSKLQYEWLKEYIDADLIKYYELMDYEELMDSIG